MRTDRQTDRQIGTLIATHHSLVVDRKKKKDLQAVVGSGSRVMFVVEDGRRVALDVNDRTDRQTDRQTDRHAHRNTPLVGCRSEDEEGRAGGGRERFKGDVRCRGRTARGSGRRRPSAGG